MPNEKNHAGRDSQWDDLRRRAEERARERHGDGDPEPGSGPSVTDLEEAERFIHELHVHQVELEMQNEELLRARQELEDIRDRYKELYEFAPTGYVTLDGTGRIRQANLTFAGMLGRERGQLEGSRFNPLVDPADRPALSPLMAACLRGEGGRIEARLLRKTETAIWAVLEFDPVVRGAQPSDEIRLAVTDITIRKEAEEALRRSEERLRLAIEAGEMGTWNYDLETGDAVWNPKMYELLGCDPNGPSIDRGDFHEYVHPEDLPRVIEHVNELLKRGKEFFDELRIVRKDREVRWLAVTGRVYRDPERRPIRVAGVISDITGRKRAEEALLELNESLENRVAERTREAERRAIQLRRLALELSSAEDRERGRIAAVLHDDLQQMLASLKFQLHALRPSTRPPEEIEQTVAKFGELVDDCIQKTRALSYDLSPPTLQMQNPVPAFEWLSLEMEKSYGLQVRIDAESGAELGSPEIASFLYRSVRELLFNTVKHSDAGHAEIQVRQAGEDIVITVRDDGRGMDISEAKSGQDRGDGFGLFRIEERVQSLGGCLEIESAPGRGCAVTLRIPAHAGQVEEEDPALQTPPGESASRVPRERPVGKDQHIFRILIVDDHDVVRHGLVSLLEDHGIFDVVAQAANGHEAVRLAFELVPDVVLMDVAMPDMDGIAATKEIKDSMPRVRVIGLSMYDDPTTRRRMLEAGASDYITKAEVSDRLIPVLKKGN